MAEREKRRATTFVTSRGAIINVAAPSIYVAPGVTPADVTSPAELREELKSGILWSLLSYNTTPAPQGSYVRQAPYLIYDNIAAVYKDEDTFIVSDLRYDDPPNPPGTQNYRVFCITRDYEILWEKTNFLCTGLDYSPVLNRVLGYRRNPNSIVELNADTGATVNTLANTALGTIGSPSTVTTSDHSVHYDPNNHTQFWYADPEHHVVLQTNWAGTIIRQYGTWNTPGEGVNLLRNPATVDPGVTWFMRILIADYGNHRILIYSQTQPPTSYVMRMPFPHPRAAYANKTSTPAVFNGGWSESYYGTCLLNSLKPIPFNHILMNTNLIKSHPTDPYRFLMSWEQSLFEIDFRLLAYQRTYPGTPVSNLLFSATVALATVAIYSPPIVDWFRPSKCLFIKATQAGTMVIQVARLLEGTGAWDGGWETYDTVTLVANTTLVYPFVAPLSIFRIAVTLGVNGTVGGWVNLIP